MAEVFISYSHHDAGLTQRLVDSLESRGWRVSYDRKLRVGDNWEHALRQMREQARFVVAVMTPAYFDSEGGNLEWRETMLREEASGRVILIPLLCEDTDIPVLLRSKRYADFRDVKEFGKAVEELTASLESFLKDEPGGAALLPTVTAPTPVEFPANLVEQLRSRDCVLYAGSGLSAPAGLPTWHLFAERFVHAAADAQLVSGQDIEFYLRALQDRQTDYVVDELVDRVPGEFLQQFLRTAFIGHTPPAAHRVIHDLPFAAVLTTNFDDLLEQTYATGTDGPVYTPDDTESLLSAFTRRAFFLLKLYGSLDRPSSVLVSPAQFDGAVSKNLAFQNFVESLFLSRTILFVGCSLEGIETYLRGVRFRATPTLTHYALAGVLGSSWEAMAGVLERRYGIRVLPYKIDDAADQLHALTELKKRVGSIAPQQTFNNAPLKRVTLTNIGAFEQVEFELHPHMNVLLGNNGVGKSTILRAIATALAGKDAEAYCVRLIRGSATTATIAIETERQSYTTVLQKKNIGAELSSLPIRALDAEGWLAMGFPPLRTMSAGSAHRTTRETQPFPTVTDVLPLVRGDVDIRLDDLQDWIADLDYRAKHEETTKSGNSRYARLIDVFFRVVTGLLDGVKVQFHSVDPATRRVTVVTEDGPVPLDYVSQGTSSVMGWVGVLLQRLYEIYGDDDATGHSDAPLHRYALVLIDEIDAHMHPAWQRVILPRISQCFPNLQLIATTHSPLVLNGLNAQNILRVIRSPETGIVSVERFELEVEGRDAEDILMGPLFGVEDLRDVRTVEKEKRYDELRARASLTPAEINEREELARALFGGSDKSARRVLSSTDAVYNALRESIDEKLQPRSEEERQRLLKETEELIQSTLTRR